MVTDSRVFRWKGAAPVKGDVGPTRADTEPDETVDDNAVSCFMECGR